MRHGIRQSEKKSMRAVLRIRPGGLVIIRPPLLRRLGGDPTNVTVELDGNRLYVGRRPSPQEARVARFESRLAERLGKLNP